MFTTWMLRGAPMIPSGEEIPEEPSRWAVPELEVDHSDDVCGRHAVGHYAGVCSADSYRLFAQDVLTALAREHDDLPVHGRRRTHVHRIHVGRGDHGFETLERQRDAEPCGSGIRPRLVAGRYRDDLDARDSLKGRNLHRRPEPRTHCPDSQHHQLRSSRTPF